MINGMDSPKAENFGEASPEKIGENLLGPLPH